MFTQCPSCNTINELDAHDLSAWMGQVRCGVCDETFNALNSLSEHAPTHGAVITSVLAPRPRPSADDAWRQVDEEAEGPALAACDDASDPGLIAEHAERETSEGRVKNLAHAALAHAAEAHAIEESAEETSAITLPEGAEVDFLLPPPETTPVPDATPVPENPPADDTTDAAAELEDLLSRRPHRRRRGWSVAAGVLLLLLGAQFVHHARAQLVRQPAIAPYLVRIYEALGLDLDPRWEVERYALLSHPEMTTEHGGDATQARLWLRASFANEARRAQPYPLLRLTLEDRWGTAVAARDFTPREYLRDETQAARLLAPGEQTHAEILVVDPGKDTVGFSLDLCLADASGVVRCANDAS